MVRSFLIFFFVCAFLALVLTAGYLLVLAGGKYNGEDISPAAIYMRARYGVPSPSAQPRKVDEGLRPKSELELLNERSQPSQPAPTPVASSASFSVPSTVSSPAPDPNAPTSADYQNLYKILKENNIKLGN